MHLSGRKTHTEKQHRQPKGVVFRTKDGTTFVRGDDGYLYQHIMEYNGLGEMNGWFKKRFRGVTKVVGKAVKIVSPVARFIPALAPYAMVIGGASFAASAAQRRNANRSNAAANQAAQAAADLQAQQQAAAAQAATQAAAAQQVQPNIPAQAIQNVVDSTSATGTNQTPAEIFAQASGQKSATKEPAKSNTVLYVGLGAVALLLLSSKRKH